MQPTGFVHRGWLNVRKLRKDEPEGGAPAGAGITLWAPQDIKAFERARRDFERRLNQGELTWDEVIIYPYCEGKEMKVRLDIEGNVAEILEGDGSGRGQNMVIVRRGQESTAYVIHVGRRYRNIAKDEEGEISPSKPLVLEPGDTVIIETLEYIALSHNIAGIISPAVSPLESGLEQETCYVDPGYCGWLSEVVSNRTNRRITLRFGTPFCKLLLIRIDVDRQRVDREEDRYKGPRFGRGLRPPQPPPGMLLGSVSPVLPYKLHERLTKLEGPWSAIYLTVIGILIAVFAGFALNVIAQGGLLALAPIQMLAVVVTVIISIAILLIAVAAIIIVIRR